MALLRLNGCESLSEREQAMTATIDDYSADNALCVFGRARGVTLYR